MDSEYAVIWAIVHLASLKYATCQVTIVNTSPTISQLSPTSLELYCNVTSNFNPALQTYKWKRNNVDLFSNGVRTVFADSRMTYATTNIGSYILFKLGINDSRCNDSGTYTCEIEGVFPVQKEDIPVDIRTFDKSKVGCYNIVNGIHCWANDTNPKAFLVLTSSSGQKNESENVTSDCGDLPSNNDVSLKETKDGRYSATLQVYQKEEEVYNLTKEFTVESTTTTESTTGGPVPSTTPVTVDDDQPPVCDWKLCIPILLALLVLALGGGGALTGYCLWINNKCPCKPSSVTCSNLKNDSTELKSENYERVEGENGATASNKTQMT